jgi:uncharacterized protein (DUF433 family)
MSIEESDMQLPDFLNKADDEIRLTGHRIRLIEVAQRYEEGFSVEGIVEFYPTLNLALIHKVVGFFLDHRPEVVAMIKENEAEMDRLRADAAPRPSLLELRTRLAQKYPSRASEAKAV